MQEQKSPNHRLVRMAAGSVRSGQDGGKHQVVRHSKIIKFSAATVQPQVSRLFFALADQNRRNRDTTRPPASTIRTASEYLGWHHRRRHNRRQEVFQPTLFARQTLHGTSRSGPGLSPDSSATGRVHASRAH